MSTIGKKLVKQQYVLQMSAQYGELWPTSGWDRFGSFGHPYEFQRVSRLGSITARYSSSGRRPNFVALDRGRHLYSAGRPSRWALAHISSSVSPVQVQLLTVVDNKGASETQLADVSSEGKIVVIDVLNNGLLQSTQFVCMKLSPSRICNYHCLSVCLSVRNFMQKLPNGFAWNFQGRLAVSQSND